MATQPSPDTKGTLPAPPPAAPSAPKLENAQDLPPEPQVHAVPFMQQPWVQNVLPFATSLGIHLGLLLMGYATFKTVEKVVQVVKEQVIVPDSTIVEGAEAGGIPNPGLGGDPTRAAKQDQYPDASEQSEGWASKPGDKMASALMAGAAGDTEAASMIGVGAGGSLGKSGGIGTSLSGSGDGSGQLAPFGVPGGGGGIGPKSNFMGVGGNARTVVFVCDASGSMMNKMGSLKVELKKAIDNLRPIQGFGVVFFQEGKPAVLANTLVMGNPESKRKAYDFVENVTTAGATEPIAGLEAAFGQQPQLVYLLTDGDFPDNAAVLEAVRKLNSAKKTKINTIAFVGKGDTDVAFIDVLKKIAGENGGVFKKVSEDDLQ